MINEYLRNKRDEQTLLAPSIECSDGFTLNVHAMWDAHCTPVIPPKSSLPQDRRVAKNAGPWSHVEICCAAEPAFSAFEDHRSVSGVVYANVPVETVDSVIAAHGGISELERAQK